MVSIARLRNRKMRDEASDVLVIGVHAEGALAQYLRRECVNRQLRAVFIDEWRHWSLSVWPDSREIALSCRRTRERATRTTVAAMLFFGHPTCPAVDDADLVYQTAEYDALLFGLCSACAPNLASRWSYVAAGLSDVTQPFESVREHPLVPQPLLKKLAALGVREAVAFGRRAFARVPGGGVEEVSDWGKMPGGLPVTLELEHVERTYCPFVGMLPEWIADCPGLVDTLLLAESGTSTKAADLLGKADIEPHGNVQGISIVAHARDRTAVHLAHRAREAHLPVRYFDLTHFYSRACPAEGVASALDSIYEASTVFARPLVGTVSTRSADDLLERHVAILRVLQARSKETINRPAAGYTNISKVAHLIRMVDDDLPVPASVATNDTETALHFLERWPGAVFKSASHMRSIATRIAVEHLPRLRLLPHCPVLFQQFVDGTNCRLHVVGSSSVAVAVSSTATDYRFADDGGAFESLQLDAKLKGRIIDASRSAGLVLSGCDLRWCSSEHRWMVLEMNRMPAFSYYDHRSRDSVADQLLRFLTNACVSPVNSSAVLR